MSIPYLHPYLSYRHYPAAYGRHLHVELASIHHDELLREQAELQRYYRTNRELFAQDRIARYEAQIVQRQIRLAEIKDRSRILSQLERNRIEGLKVGQQLRYQQTLRQMEVDRYLRGDHILKSQKLNSFYRPGEDLMTGRSEQRINKLDYKSEAKDRNGSKQGNVTLLRRKSQQNDVRNSLIRNYQSQTLRNQDKLKNAQQKYQSCFFAQPKRKQNRIEKKAKDQNYAIKNAYLSDQKQKYPAKISNNNNRRVTFSLENNEKHNRSARSQQQIDHILTPMRTNRALVKKQKTNTPRKSVTNASKRIENRLKLSSDIYKDSQWRNTKHEIEHLFNTYSNQLRLRQQMKSKINNNSKIISKYCIVVQER